MKTLVCCESASLCTWIQTELEGAGHEIAIGPDPQALASCLDGAGALLVEPAWGRRVIALLRDRGFAGRAVIMVGPDAGESGEEIGEKLRDAGADAMLALSPPEGLARRFALAVGGRRRLLLVDSNERAAALAKAELEQAGFEVSIAPDAESATSLILKRGARPDLVLVELEMPRVSGAQFCRFIKMNERFRTLKVFFCSGERREKVAALAAACQADGFILKEELLGKGVLEGPGA